MQFTNCEMPLTVNICCKPLLCVTVTTEGQQEASSADKHHALLVNRHVLRSLYTVNLGHLSGLCIVEGVVIITHFQVSPLRGKQEQMRLSEAVGREGRHYVGNQNVLYFLYDPRTSRHK